MNRNTRFVLRCLAVVLTAVAAFAGGAQTYPHKPIRVIAAETGGLPRFNAC